MSTEIIKTISTQLRDRLPDDFSRTVLDGSLMAYASVENPLRLNQFSTGLRELFGHVLSSMAPDDEVYACQWFRSETDNGKPTRRQRAIYWTQGGLSDQCLESLGLDIGDVHSRAIRVINDLSKYTHVRPDTLSIPAEKADDFVTEALGSFLDMYEAFDDCRSAVLAAIEGHIDQETMVTFTETVIGDVDLLSTHSRVDSAEVTSVSVKMIDARFVNYIVDGIVNVELNYGSDGDRRRGEGATLYTYFPFSMTTMAPVSDYRAFRDAVPIVNTDSWYADDDEECTEKEESGRHSTSDEADDY